jgi:glycosyltransferase involved in cell wall biosynthesis
MLKKKLLIICPFPEGVAAGQRLKYEQYLDDWRNEGFDITISSFMDHEMWNVAYKKGHFFQKLFGTLRGYVRRFRDALRIHKFDLVYVFMWVTPFGTSIPERFVRYFSNSLIFDVEDSVLVEQINNKSSNPNPLTQFFKNRNKAKFLIQESDFIISSSPFLNDQCIKMNRYNKSKYISSSINTDRFIPAKKNLNNDLVTIGWTGTFSSKPYLDRLSLIFQQLALKVDFKLRIIGNFDYELPGVDLEVIQWSLANEVRDMQKIDIGVYPLNMDEWVMGKSGLKAIQYLAFGIPVVATDIGTTPLIITNNINGYLTKTDKDWLDSLEKLVLNPELRHNMGAKARKKALECYSTKVISSEYRMVLQAVMGDSND